MKRNISHLLYIVAIGFFTSCSDFLDVAPKDKVLEEDQYKTEAGIHGALNGLYRQLISTSLYGANMEQLKAYLPIYGKADIIRFSISTIF